MTVSGPLLRIVPDAHDRDEVPDPGVRVWRLAVVRPAPKAVAGRPDRLPTPDLAIPPAATALVPAPAPARPRPHPRFVPVLVPMPDDEPSPPPPVAGTRHGPVLGEAVAEIEVRPRPPAGRIARRALDVFGRAVGLLVLSRCCGSSRSRSR